MAHGTNHHHKEGVEKGPAHGHHCVGQHIGKVTVIVKSRVGHKYLRREYEQFVHGLKGLAHHVYHREEEGKRHHQKEQPQNDISPEASLGFFHIGLEIFGSLFNQMSLYCFHIHPSSLPSSSDLAQQLLDQAVAYDHDQEQDNGDC